MLFILILQVISAVAFSVTKVMPFRGFSCIIQIRGRQLEKHLRVKFRKAEKW